MGHIHRTPHLAHVALLLFIFSSHNSVILYYIDHIYSSISIKSQHIIIWSSNQVSLELSISYSKYFSLFCAYSIMFYFCFNISYMLSTFHILMHTCATCSHDLSSGFQHPDRA